MHAFDPLARIPLIADWVLQDAGGGVDDEILQKLMSQVGALGSEQVRSVRVGAFMAAGDRSRIFRIAKHIQSRLRCITVESHYLASPWL